jgi:hypothetical protein
MTRLLLYLRSWWRYPLPRHEEVTKRLLALRLSHPTTKCCYERLMRG